MVEAIEDLFVPVLVYNNKSSDSALLKQFGEPSWNNPIVRFLNGDGQDVIKRESGVWTVAPMASRMVAALTAARQEVPSYLSGLAIDKTKLQKATFAMHCIPGRVFDFGENSSVLPVCYKSVRAHPRTDGNCQIACRHSCG